MVRNFVSVVILVPLIVACAPFAASSAPVLTSDQDALVLATCDQVMGLAKSGIYRDQCRDSLSQSLARKVLAQATAVSYGDCRKEGVADASLAACMLDRRSTDQTAHPQAIKLSYDMTATQGGKSYFDVTPSVVWRREQYACAQLGLLPGTGAYGECLSSLEGALLPDPN